jgi:glyceraldehyde 3-phosphate dehydrogenase
LDERRQQAAAMVRVAINGFGRMGRLCFRILASGAFPGVDIVQVNEIKGGCEAAAHLVVYDSVKGRWARDAAVDPAAPASHFIVKEATVLRDGQPQTLHEFRVLFTEHADPADLDWAAVGVDIVLECTGKVLTVAALNKHLKNGAKKVVVSAPVKEPSVLNIVMVRASRDGSLFSSSQSNP